MDYIYSPELTKYTAQMLPYKSLIKIERNATLPLYKQICNSIISLITNGTLQSGRRLPSSRMLSELIGINRNTVKLGYEELISQGWAKSVDRKGVFVLSVLPIVSKMNFKLNNEIQANENFSWNKNHQKGFPYEPSQKSSLAIDGGFPDVRLAPVDLLMREYRSLSKKSYGKNFLKYGSNRGSEHLRLALQNYLLNSRGVSVPTENILITKGSQMGIYLTAHLLVNPGDTVAVGISNYPIADHTFKLFGANLLRIPIDGHGMDIDYLKNILQHKKIKAAYIIPHHHFPTTVTMSMERRLKLLQLSKEYGFAIIEDDYDFDFHYSSNPILPLASIKHSHNVIYIGSISKTFAPSTRIGFVTGTASFIESAAVLRELIDKQGDTLLEEAFASLYDEGEMDRHFRRSLKIYEKRRDIFCEILKKDFADTVGFKVPEGGLAIWTNFDKKIDVAKIAEEAKKNDLHISNGSFYKNGSFSSNSLRMGFASLNENEMTAALQILKKIIH